jgi:hypothetical protein
MAPEKFPPDLAGAFMRPAIRRINADSRRRFQDRRIRGVFAGVLVLLAVIGRPAMRHGAGLYVLLGANGIDRNVNGP